SHLNIKELKLCINAITLESPAKNIQTPNPLPEPPPDSNSDISNQVPPQYHSHLDVFNPIKVKKLLLHCPYDYNIPIEDDILRTIFRKDTFNVQHLLQPHLSFLFKRKLVTFIFA
ncbi:hypothetical protein H0H87_005930, partial [Tephrocybe sp. NHM501043]